MVSPSIETPRGGGSRPSCSSLNQTLPSPSSPSLPSSSSSPLSALVMRSAASQPTQTTTFQDSPPWEVIRCSVLKKITSKVFGAEGRRAFGKPTFLTVGSLIFLGTSRGLVLAFDSTEALKTTIGPGTKSVECGPVMALAVSADQSMIATGHESGQIFIWKLDHPAKPFIQIPPIEKTPSAGERGRHGHLAGASIVHIGFLGARHTALVSADIQGMAFSHLASRGLGAVARSIKTTKILGQYPSIHLGRFQRNMQSSRALALEPLPLGNVEHPLDSMGLTAMLTPEFLVIVSTMPQAERHLKLRRPQDNSLQSDLLSGCLAWFPSVRLNRPPTSSVKEVCVSLTKLAFSWSSALTIIDVHVEEQQDPNNQLQAPPLLIFLKSGLWKCPETIVVIQWLGRSLISVLTISQRLYILQDDPLRLTDSCDLILTDIYHQDLFSYLDPLRSPPTTRNDGQHPEPVNNPGPRGFAHSFYMSVQAYKDRIFILGTNEISDGTLSNWADRLMALLVEGDYLAAIELATNYYSGNENHLTVGLPDRDETRHRIVKEKLVDLITASVKYSFIQIKDRPSSQTMLDALRILTSTTFKAYLEMEESHLLFDDLFELYHDASLEYIFFETLDAFILNGTVTAIPPDVAKSMVEIYSQQEESTARLERLICKLDTSTLDIDQTTSVAKKFLLYDALCYLWIQGVGDCVSALVELLSFISLRLDKFENLSETSIDTGDIQEILIADKLFPFLANSLTGKIYPSGEDLPEDVANRNKAELYAFLFAGGPLEWPRGTGKKLVLPVTGPKDSTLLPEQRPYPYLRLVLRYNTPRFLNVMQEAFEDPFFNELVTKSTPIYPDSILPNINASSLPTRQTIISILRQVVRVPDFEFEDVVYVDVFIAQNLPKFSQFLLLPDDWLHSIITRLCTSPEVCEEDRQLSLEYLFSQHRPPDMEPYLPLLREAKFYRVLKSVFRSTRQYSELLKTYFEDPEDKDHLFTCIANVFRGVFPVPSAREIGRVRSVLIDNATDLVQINPEKTARLFKTSMSDLVDDFQRALPRNSKERYEFFRAIMEPVRMEEQVAEAKLETKLDPRVMREYEQEYVRLMCIYNHADVFNYVINLSSDITHLDQLLLLMEESGALDAVLVVLSKKGKTQDAMGRLVKYLQKLESAMIGLLRAQSMEGIVEPSQTTASLLEEIQKYCRVGLWLCNNSVKLSAIQDEVGIDGATGRRSLEFHRPGPEMELDESETLWLDFTTAVVEMSRRINQVAQDIEIANNPDRNSEIRLVENTLRTQAQQLFIVLLTMTSSGPDCSKAKSTGPKKRNLNKNGPSSSSSSPLALSILTSQYRGQCREGPKRKNLTNAGMTSTSSSHPNYKFLKILRAFLARMASSSASEAVLSLLELRPILMDVFSAYSSEAVVLELANQFLNKELFKKIARANRISHRGWKPRQSICVGCGIQLWGKGVGLHIWDQWELRVKQDLLCQIASRRSEVQPQAGGDEQPILRRHQEKDRAVVSGRPAGFLFQVQENGLVSRSRTWNAGATSSMKNGSLDSQHPRLGGAQHPETGSTSAVTTNFAASATTSSTTAAAAAATTSTAIAAATAAATDATTTSITTHFASNSTINSTIHSAKNVSAFNSLSAINNDTNSLINNTSATTHPPSQDPCQDLKASPMIVFACGHVLHRACVLRLMATFHRVGLKDSDRQEEPEDLGRASESTTRAFTLLCPSCHGPDEPE